MLHKVVISLESVGEILKYCHSNESELFLSSCGVVHFAMWFVVSSHLSLKSIQCLFRGKKKEEDS